MKKVNPEHVRKGKLYEWKKLLNNTQKKKVDIIVSSVLRLFGYPRRGGLYPERLYIKKIPSSLKIIYLKHWIIFATAFSGGWKLIKDVIKEKKPGLR